MSAPRNLERAIADVLTARLYEQEPIDLDTAQGLAREWVAKPGRLDAILREIDGLEHSFVQCHVRPIMRKSGAWS